MLKDVPSVATILVSRSNILLIVDFSISGIHEMSGACNLYRVYDLSKCCPLHCVIGIYVFHTYPHAHKPLKKIEEAISNHQSANLMISKCRK